MTAELHAPGTGTGGVGPAGPPGGEFVFTQDVPSSLWLIQHNLGMFPNVTVVDTLEREVETDINYIDENNLTSGSANPATGKAYLS